VSDMTNGISAQTVADWAEGTLQEWLPGYTDVIEGHGCQYRIKLMDDDTYSVEPHHGYFGPARFFRVTVSVVEETT